MFQPSFRHSVFRLVIICLSCLAIGAVANAATVTIGWDPSAGPDVAGYVIYWGTQSGVYSNSLDAGNQTQQSVAGLADGTTYYLIVKAYNSTGMLSGPSNEVSWSSPSSPSSPPPSSPPPSSDPPAGAWTLTSVHSDFNRDGTPDLVFQDDTTRQTLVWYQSGPPNDSLVGWNWLATSGVTGWRLVCTADFNGDGTPDLVWQNDATRQVVVWYMGGTPATTILSSASLATSGVTGWRLVDAVDLNHDGKPDLVWQNDTTFQVVVWYMGGSGGNTPLGSNSLATSGVTGWRLVAIADFNGDGAPDLVWQNAASQVLVWYMGGSQGNVPQSSDWLSAGDETGWTVVGANDFDGNGTPDLVWQNTATRQVVVWYTGGPGGNILKGSQALASPGVPGWTPR